MDNDLLTGVAAGLEGYYKGRNDAEDRKYKRLEMMAKLQAQANDDERNKTESEFKRKQLEQLNDPQRRKEDLTIKLASANQEPIYDQGGLLTGTRYKPEYLKTQGTKTASAAEPKQNEYVAAGFAKRMEAAQEKIKNVLAQGYDPTTLVNSVQQSSYFPEYFKSGQTKEFEQAARDFVSSVLRKESGAAIPFHEIMTDIKKYFPQVGDTPDVARNKELSRMQAIENLKAEGHRAYGLIPSTVGLVKADGEKQNKIKVTNGKETRLINAADLNDAIKDGYKEL